MNNLNADDESALVAAFASMAIYTVESNIVCFV